eukprot:6578012-Pyramimonas_sp.AAC.1
MGAWKDADHKHTQSVNNVIKLRTALAHAEEKEQKAAEVLAAAEEAKQQAAALFAKIEGITIVEQQADSKGNGNEQQHTPNMTLTWDESLFQQAEDMEIEQSEKDQLK